MALEGELADFESHRASPASGAHRRPAGPQSRSCVRIHNLTQHPSWDLNPEG
jgi:hypothetical protein